MKIKKNEIKFFFEKINPIIENYMEKIQLILFLIKKIYLLEIKNYDITNEIIK